MKHYVKKTITKTETTLEKTTCDCCHKIIDRQGSYDDIDVTIEGRDGKSYPSCGFSGEVYDADICLACFRDRVVPALHELGIHVDWKDV